MKNKNLPEIKKENIFSKIRKIMMKLFKKDESKCEEKVIIANKENTDNFKNSIKLADGHIFELQEKYKLNQLDVQTLSDEELEKLIDLYKKQIEEKKKELLKYKVNLKNK